MTSKDSIYNKVFFLGSDGADGYGYVGTDRKEADAAVMEVIADLSSSDYYMADNLPLPDPVKGHIPANWKQWENQFSLDYDGGVPCLLYYY